MLISRKASRFVIVLVLTNIGQVTAADSKTTSPERVNAPVSVDHPSPAVGIKIKQIRLEPPEEGDASTTAVLRFDAVNDSSDRVADLLLEVFIVHKLSRSSPATPRFVAGPFTVQEKRVIEPGYRLQYEIVLKNVSSNCDCLPSVQVRSARFLSASEQ